MSYAICGHWTKECGNYHKCLRDEHGYCPTPEQEEAYMKELEEDKERGWTESCREKYS